MYIGPSLSFAGRQQTKETNEDCLLALARLGATIPKRSPPDHHHHHQRSPNDAIPNASAGNRCLHLFPSPCQQTPGQRGNRQPLDPIAVTKNEPTRGPSSPPRTTTLPSTSTTVDDNGYPSRPWTVSRIAAIGNLDHGCTGRESHESAKWLAG